MRTIGEDTETFIQIMCSILKVGEAEFMKSHAGLMPLARCIIMQHLHSIGYNKSEIGNAMEKNHSSVIASLKRIEEVLKTPGYDDVRNLKQQFIKEVERTNERIKRLGLSRCIWKVKPKERLCNFCKMNNCIDRKI